jgi:hypothetical protein
MGAEITLGVMQKSCVRHQHPSFHTNLTARDLRAKSRHSARTALQHSDPTLPNLARFTCVACHASRSRRTHRMPNLAVFSRSHHATHHTHSRPTFTGGVRLHVCVWRLRSFPPCPAPERPSQETDTPRGAVSCAAHPSPRTAERASPCAPRRAPLAVRASPHRAPLVVRPSPCASRRAPLAVRPAPRRVRFLLDFWSSEADGRSWLRNGDCGRLRRRGLGPILRRKLLSTCRGASVRWARAEVEAWVGAADAEDDLRAWCANAHQSARWMEGARLEPGVRSGLEI